jgi:hypothetical protein
MELSQEEKDRIVAEEKLRMETRKEFFKENFGRHGWGWRGGWQGHGCHRPCGGGFVKVLVIALIIFAACHFWHNSCGYGMPYYGYGAPVYQVPQAQAIPPASK